jgi:hypothetical protein
VLALQRRVSAAADYSAVSAELIDKYKEEFKMWGNT